MSSLGMFEAEGTRKGISVFHTPRNFNYQRFLVVVADTPLKDEERTQLVMASYERKFYGIVKSPEVVDDHNMRFEHLKERLSSSGIGVPTDYSAQMLTQPLQPAEPILYDYALRITETKMAGVRGFPPYTKWVIGGAMVLLAMLTGLWLGGILSVELYETFLGFSAIAIVFDLLPSISVKRRRRY